MLPSAAVDTSWPDAMVRELQACRTAGDRLAWAARWPEHLSGRAARDKQAAARPARPARFAPDAAIGPSGIVRRPS